MPLATALLSAFWTRTERLTPRKVAGILVGIAGTAMLFWPQERVGVMEVLAMIAVLAGALGASINLVMMKKYGAHSNAFVLNFFAMGLGAMCLLAMSVVLESWSSVKWTMTNALATFYLAVFGSVVAFSAYYYLVKRMDATVVSLSTLIIPIVALALGRVFLGETVSQMAVAGITTILIGVGATLVPAKRSSRM
jgi:drug/metabolite transporter (DMT)-like permease